MSATRTRVKLPTDAEIARGKAIGEQEQPNFGADLKYSPANDTIDLTLFNGTRLILARKSIPSLAALSKRRAAEMKLGPFGETISVESEDIDVSIAGVTRRAVGADYVGKASASKSEAKAAAAKRNGLLGGRRRKTAG